MIKKIGRWSLKLMVTGFLLFVLLVIIILNPILCYGKKTSHSNFIVYSDQPANRELDSTFNQASKLIGSSELYDPKFKIEICLNDGSDYPNLIRKIKGKAFAIGFYDKVVILGNAFPEKNVAELNGYKWNFTELLAHEMIHCLQFNDRGLWHSNPIAHIPEWKWEGYPEYIARHQEDQQNLAGDIKRLKEAEHTGNNNGWIYFKDSTGTVIPYYRYWLLVKYCKDIKRMTYKDLLSNLIKYDTILKEMMDWYDQQNKVNRFQ